MTDTLQTTFFEFLNEDYYILIEISPKFVHVGPTDNKTTVVQVIHWSDQQAITYLEYFLKPTCKNVVVFSSLLFCKILFMTLLVTFTTPQTVLENS